MVKICSHCGGEDQRPFYTCNYCNFAYCSEHRLPEKHNCPALSTKEPSGKWFSSHGPTTLGRTSELTEKRDRKKQRGAKPAKIAKRLPGASKTPPKPSSPPVTTKPRETDRMSAGKRFFYAALLLLHVPVWIFRSGISIGRRGISLALTPKFIIGCVLVLLTVGATVGTGIAPLDNAIGSGIDATTVVANEVVSVGADITSTNKTEVRMEIHKQVNRERVLHGLPNLSYSTQLQRPAQSHSEDMAQNSYFSHTSPLGRDFSDRYRKHGVSCRGGGENILKTTESPDMERDFAKEVVEAWMNSPGHRENILRPRFNTEGIGIATEDGTAYVTQNFC